MPWIYCKIYLELNWTKNCAMFDITEDTIFKITNTKLYVPIVTLSNENGIQLTKQLNEGFKGSVYWNEYQTKTDLRKLMNNNITDIRIYLNASFQGLKKLIVLVFNNTDNGVYKVE